MQRIQTVPTGDILNDFMHKHDIFTRKTTPYSLHAGNTLYKNIDAHATLPTSDTHDITHLSPYSEGVMRFLHTDTGGSLLKALFF